MGQTIKHKSPAGQGKGLKIQSKDNILFSYQGTIYPYILPGKHLLFFIQNGRRHSALISHEGIQINEAAAVCVKRNNGGLSYE
ncbi:MAG: hypothetical protein HY840_12625 [Bacteroidetes bacterium]|nr:hypothetical protein [Bacteroidota bacterium]